MKKATEATRIAEAVITLLRLLARLRPDRAEVAGQMVVRVRAAFLTEP